MIPKDINKAKVDLMNEMKRLCEEIQKTQTFSGLISLESRIQNLHENVVILKYLDQNSLSNHSVAEEVKQEKEEIVEMASEKSLPNITLNLNDKIAFQNQLFNRDEALFQEAVNRLNATQSLEEVQSVLKPYAIQFAWESKEEFVQRFEELIEKRFG